MAEVSLKEPSKALLMVALGPEGATDIYRCLNEEEIEQLTKEIACKIASLIRSLLLEGK